MAVLRKIALGLLLAAAAGVLAMASWELWNYSLDSSALQNRFGADSGARARLLQGRMDMLAKRVGDMELLVLVLLGTSGLYAIVFVASSYFSATSFARQADQTVGHIQDQIGLAMRGLRALQEETEQRLRRMTAPPPAPVPPAPLPLVPVPEVAPPAPTPPAAFETEIREIAAHLAAFQAEDWEDPNLSEHARLELVADENAVARLELSAGASPGSRIVEALAGIYLAFGRIYGRWDAARSRFYLERALRLAQPQSALASEIHYQLACRLAAVRDFPRAMRELSAAFEHQFKTLDENLASDIEEGGKLYELASTAPFDKAVNDLLLNMSIGIG